MYKIKKGDTVKMILGKDNGKEGSVERVLPKTHQLIVSGINIYKRHVRKTGQSAGGIIDMIKPVNVSNVSLICPNCKKATRVGFEETKEGKKRLCKKCKKTF